MRSEKSTVTSKASRENSSAGELLEPTTAVTTAVERLSGVKPPTLLRPTFNCSTGSYLSVHTHH